MAKSSIKDPKEILKHRGYLGMVQPEKDDRLVIFGVHPTDQREPKKVYCFWASMYLEAQFPCIGDLVVVGQKSKNFKKCGLLYVTDVMKWPDAKKVLPEGFEPTKIARWLHIGTRWSNFEYEVADE